MKLDVNARATEAGALLEWRALTENMRQCLADGWRSVSGWTIYGQRANGGVVEGLRKKGLIGAGHYLTARGVYVREVGRAEWAGGKR